jgi:hypothetical protein
MAFLRSVSANGLAVFAFATVVACSGAGSGQQPGWTVESVVVTPGEAKVQPGDALALEAKVSGTGSLPLVQWHVYAASPGALPIGWVGGSDGVYHAPDRAPSVTTDVRVVATCGGVSGAAILTVPSASIALTGGADSAVVGEVLQFTVEVDGTSDRRVEWRAQHGSVDGTGRYTAPPAMNGEHELDVVSVRSVANGLTAQREIALRGTAPTISALSGSAGPGDTLTIRGAGFVQLYGSAHGARVYFHSGAGGPIRTAAASVSNDTILVKVPIGATSGELRVAVPPSWNPSAPVQFERAPRLRLHVARQDLVPGESIPLEVAVLGVPAPVPITFSADAGAISGDLFVAPEVADGAWVVVRACVTDTSICSAVTLGVHPFLVAPSPAIAPLGGTLTLSAHGRTGPVSPRFSLVSGPWSVSPDGAFTSSAVPGEVGEAWVRADDGTHVELAPVVVAGGVPGEVARVAFEYFDDRVIGPALGPPSGAVTHAVAVDGNRAWVLASDRRGEVYWLDTYDIADPAHPRWIGATESSTPSASLTLTNGRVYAISGLEDGGIAVAAYDVSSALPVLVGRMQRPRAPLTGRVLGLLELDAEAGTLVYADPPPFGARSVTTQVYALSDASLSTVRDVTLTFPSDTDVDSWLIRLSAQGGLAYASYPAIDGSWRLGAWDLSTAAATWLGSTPAVEAYQPMSFLGPLLLVGDHLFDRRPPVPSLVARVPGDLQRVTGHGTRHVLTDGPQSYLLDLVDPTAPRLFSSFPSIGQGALADGFLYEPRAAGIALHDISPGGPIPSGPGAWIGSLFSELNGVAVREDRAYVTGYGPYQGGFLATVNVASGAPEVEAVTALASAGMALGLDGDRLLVGTSSSLEVRSATNPHAPPSGSLPLDVFTVTPAADLAWVGTRSGDLVAIDLVAAGGPMEIGRLSMGAYPRRIRVISPGTVAVALQTFDYSSGDLAIVDVAVPSNPTLLANAGLGIPVVDLAVEGAVAALATPAGLVTVDLTVPHAPATLAVVRVPPDVPQTAIDPPWCVAAEFHDGIAWIGTYLANGAVLGYDLRDPSRPREVARWQADGSVLGGMIVQLAFDGPRMVVSKITYHAGLDQHTLVALDVSQPRNLLRRWVLPTTLQPP